MAGDGLTKSDCPTGGTPLWTTAAAPSRLSCRLRRMDITIRRAAPEEYAAPGEIAAQADPAADRQVLGGASFVPDVTPITSELTL